MIFGFNALDLLVLLVMLVSVAVGLWRGLLREAIALLGWIAAIVLSVRYAQSLGEALPIEAVWPALKTVMAGALIVVGCVFTAALIGWLVRRLIEAARLSAADRTLGGIFGLLRGGLVVMVLVLFVGATPIGRQPFWRASSVLPWFEAALRAAAPWLPPALAQRAGTRQ